MSGDLDDDQIALGYDQRVQLGIAGRGYEEEPKRQLELRNAQSPLGTFSFLWHHTDPAIRFPFQPSVWLFVLGVALGAMVSYLLEHSITSYFVGG
jgi:hypothetical protein